MKDNAGIPEDKFKEFAFIVKQCKLCDGKGYRFDLKKTDGLVLGNKAKQCECVSKMTDYTLFKEAHIPSEYYDLEMSDFLSKPENEAVLNLVRKIISNIRRFHEAGWGLFFYGGPGTGKTMLALEILKKALRTGFTGYYEWFPHIIRDLMKKGYSADPQKEFYAEVFKKKDILVVDELGKETQDKYTFNKEDIARILEIDILKNRGNMPTILISNIKDPEGLEQQYGAYVASVLRQKFKMLNLVSTDFRTRGGVENFFKTLGEEE